MTDRAELETVLTVQADRVLAGFDSFERSLHRIEQAHMTTGRAAEEHGSKVDAFIGKMTRLADVGKLFVAWEAIERVMGALQGVETFNIDLLRTTEILGGNAQAASTWVVIAHEMGLGVDQIDKAFAKLATDMNSGSNAALKQMGIAAEDTHGKLRPLNDVINDAADYFQRHAGAANNAALANAIFGRSGFELIPVLEQGRAGIAAITEEARKYGLILDAETVQRNAAFTFQLKEAQLAAEGFGISVGNAALPAVAALGQAFSRVVADNLPAFIAAINRAASYVIGFVEAFTGMELHVGEGALALSSLAGITGDTGAAMDSAGGAAKALAEAEAHVRDQAKDATAALDDQIRALQAQTEVSRFADQQAKLQENLKNKGQDIQDLQRERYQQFWQGNFQTASDVGEKITRAQQEQADLQKQLTAGVNDEQTKQRITALETQKRAVQKAADDQLEAMQRAAQGTSAAMTAAANSMGPIFGKGGAEAAKSLKFALDSSAEDIGKSMGTKLMDAIFGVPTTVTLEGHGTREIEKTFRQGGGDFLKIGNAIGDAIGTGITTSLGKALSNWFKQAGSKVGIEEGSSRWSNESFPNKLQDLSNLLLFHSGGRVPGSRGADVPIMARAGETVLTEDQAGNFDTSGIERRLDQLIAILAGNSSAGVQASLYNAIDQTKRARARGILGATA